MKKILGSLILLVVLVLGSYYGMGIITERTIKQHLNLVNKSNGLAVKVIGYRRGWFTSHADLQWHLQIPEHMLQGQTPSQVIPAKDYDITMPIIIHHGPIIFANHSVKFGLGYAYTDMRMPEKMDQEFANSFMDKSTKPQLDLSLLVTYLCKSKLNVTVPHFILFPKSGGQFDWVGMTNTLIVSPDADKLKGDLEFKGLEFLQNDNRFLMKKAHSEYHIHKADNGLYLGSADITIPSISASQKEQTVFEVREFRAQSESDVEDGLFYSNLSASLESLHINQKHYGPGKLEMSIKNLDAASLARINQQITQAQQGGNVEKQQVIFAIIPEMSKLLSRGPQFSITTLQMELPQGTLQGNLSLTLPEGEQANPFELLQKLQGQGKLSLPIEVIRLALIVSNKQALQIQQMQQANSADTASAHITNNMTISPAELDKQAEEKATTQLSNMVKSGLVVQKDKYYEIEVVLETGKLQVNGQPFNPSMIKF